MFENQIKWKHVPTRWKRIWGDKNSCIHFYDSLRLLTFAWDGQSDWIEVCVDGVQEEPSWLLAAPQLGSLSPFLFMRTFDAYCREAIAIWDMVIGSDPDEDDAGYHCIINREGVSEEYTVFPPVGVTLQAGAVERTTRTYTGNPIELWDKEWHEWSSEHNNRVLKKRLGDSDE